MPGGIQFFGSGPPLTQADLAECEKALRVKFPPGYRDLLLRYNGGKPTPGYFLLPNGEPVRIKRLFAIHPPKAGADLVHRARQLRDEYDLPKRYLPIADLDADSILLLDTAGKAAGKLYFWSDREEGFRLGDSVYENVDRLYFEVNQLIAKLGPRHRRQDADALFFQLAAAAQGGKAKTIQKIVKQGQDINYVLPGHGHPIFGAIDMGSFGSVQLMLELGTRVDHVDPDWNETVVGRLKRALEENRSLVASFPKNNSLHKWAAKRIQLIEAILDFIDKNL